MAARKSFAMVLKRLRAQRGLTQEALAALAGISMRSVSLMECDKQQPTISTIEALADALQISMTELISAVEHESQRTTPHVGLIANQQWYLDSRTPIMTR